MSIDDTKETAAAEEPVVVEKKKQVKSKKTSHLYKEGMYDSPEYKANHKMKCKGRAAKVFGVTLEHLESSYFTLNGKKLAGIYITEIIDRTGYSNGNQLSRAQLSVKYGHDGNVTPIEVVEQKVISILQSSNVKTAYTAYLRDIKDEFTKETNDKAVYGE